MVQLTGAMLLKLLAAVIPNHVMDLDAATKLAGRFRDNASEFSYLSRGSSKKRFPRGSGMKIPGSLNRIVTELGMKWRTTQEESVARAEVLICVLLCGVYQDGFMDLPSAESLHAFFAQSPFPFRREVFTKELRLFVALIKRIVQIVPDKGHKELVVEKTIGPLSQPGVPVLFGRGGGEQSDWTHVRYLSFEGLSNRHCPETQRKLDEAGIADLKGLQSLPTVRQPITPDFERDWFGRDLNDVDDSATDPRYLSTAKSSLSNEASGAQNDDDDRDDLEGLCGVNCPKTLDAGFTDTNGLNSVETTTLTRNVECARYGPAYIVDEQTPWFDPSLTVGPDSPSTAYLTVGEQDTDQESLLGRRSFEHAPQQPQPPADFSADQCWERDSDGDMDESIHSDDFSGDGKRHRRVSEDDLQPWAPLIKGLKRDW